MDKLSDYKYTMESCNSCGQCRFILGPKMKSWKFSEICPIYKKYKFEAYSGQGLINIAQEILEGKLSLNSEVVDHIYTCTTCGACDINCKSIRDMEVIDTILMLRSLCVEEGWGPKPAHKVYADSVIQNHNIFGLPHEQRGNWLKGNFSFDTEAGVAFFAGCTSSYKYPELARNIVTILNAAEIDFTILHPEEYCCGGPLWRTGQLNDAKKLVEQNAEVFRKKGIRTLITGCAECFGTFRGFYPRIVNFDVKVLHISQVIQDLLKNKRLTFSKRLDMKVTYHDPCMLGRLSEPYVPWQGQIKAFGYHDPPKTWRRGTYGVYSAPRDVLTAIPGIELIEMTRNAENGFCCGAGGGVADAFPDFSLWICLERLEEIKSTGAQAVVSGCPWCQSQFEKALVLDGNEICYYDISELVAQAL